MSVEEQRGSTGALRALDTEYFDFVERRVEVPESPLLLFRVRTTRRLAEIIHSVCCRNDDTTYGVLVCNHDLSQSEKRGVADSAKNRT